MQRRGVPRHQLKQMLGQRHYHVLGLSVMNKRIRWDFSCRWVSPAQQHFQPGDLQRLRIHDGLIDNVELIAFDPGEDLFSRPQADAHDVVAE